MSHRPVSPRTWLRLSAGLLLAGQFLYIVVTRFHAGGDANNHPAIFAAYATNEIWTAVHLGQFVSMAVLMSGLLILFFAVEGQDGAAQWAGRFGAAATVAALALYGVLQAVDGVALKQSVNAWASASAPEKAARFASAESLRWLEWGVRSYQDFTLGLALLLFAVAMGRTAWMSRPLACLMGLSGLAYWVQGWIVGVEGFSPAQSAAIVLAWILSLAWMVWLAVIAWRMKDAATAGEGGLPAAA